MSIAVIAPESRNWSIDKTQPSTSYNATHLTPRFFTHFFKWWSLFSGVMSLPVRQGPLWPGVTKTAKKFARHLATVKYKLLLAPLFVSHMYKHKDYEEFAENEVTATGLKVRLDSLKLDVHQRREQVRTLHRGPLKQQQASAMRIHKAQLDLLSADFRAVSASIFGTNADDLESKSDDVLPSLLQPMPSADLSRFTIPDHNLDWIDMDDFVELDWILPQDSNPPTQILPLAFTPRFTYFRQTDHGQAASDETGFSKFGDEPTHECVMSPNNDEFRVQMELIKERLAIIEAQMLSFEMSISRQHIELSNGSGGEGTGVKDKYDLFVRQANSLARRRNFLNSGLRHLERRLAGDEGRPFVPEKADGGEAETSSRLASDYTDSVGDGKGFDGLYASAMNDFAMEFNNRFIIHNVQLKWNNSLRNIVLRYIHQVSQRRGFVYYMSRRAVKFILDIVAEQNKNKNGQGRQDSTASTAYQGHDESDNGKGDVDVRIEQLLNDVNRFVNAEDTGGSSANNGYNSDNNNNNENNNNTVPPESQSDDSSEHISPEFTPQNSYHVRLIAPQIQLQSEKNQKSVLLVAAKGMQLKVVSIMDKEIEYDDVSGLVQRRFSLDMDGAQFFVATHRNLMAHLQFYAGNRYGNSPGSAWPPWITLEAMFDFELNPFGFSRIVQKTSASLRYDKYNSLRLKYGKEVAKAHPGQGHAANPVNRELRMDQIKVDFPHFRAICNSDEYYTMYIIILDLLLYSEPLEKERNERLEKILLTSDFSDLRGAPEMVFRLQDRIRRLQEIKECVQVHAKYLDKDGWEDCLMLDRDLASCEDELFFLMKAITTSQRKMEPAMSKTHGLLRWSISASEVVWHLMKNKSERLVEFQLRNAEYERTDNSDGSNGNSVAIDRVYGLNLLPDALYPQIIVPYLERTKNWDATDDRMINIKWHMLEAVAGIPVVDNFEVLLFPLKIQLEHELGQKLFEYIFPGVGANAFENGAFSPFMIKTMRPIEEDMPDEDESSDVASSRITSRSSLFSTADDHGCKPTTGPGAIEQRLQPTFMLSSDGGGGKQQHWLPSIKDLQTSLPKDPKGRLGLGISESSRPISQPPSRSATFSALGKKRSADNLRLSTRNNPSRHQIIHPHTIGSPTAASEEEKRKKWNIGRPKHSHNKEPRSELAQMISRASNYMTLAHVRVNDVVLCVSYKGKGDRNFEDIHDFVFRLPVLEYQNKTWSNLDLALRLKKDVIRALISHAPAILGNKFSNHRQSKQQLKRQNHLVSSLALKSAGDSLKMKSSQSVSMTSLDDSNSELVTPPPSNLESLSPLEQTSSNISRAHSEPDNSVAHVTSPQSFNEADFDFRWEVRKNEERQFSWLRVLLTD